MELFTLVPLQDAKYPCNREFSQETRNCFRRQLYRFIGRFSGLFVEYFFKLNTLFALQVRLIRKKGIQGIGCPTEFNYHFCIF